MKLSARIGGLLVVLLFLFSFLTTHVYAQTPTPSLSNAFMRTDSSVPLTISTVTQGVFLGMLSSTTCVLGGIDFFTPAHKCLNYDVKSGNFAYAKEAGGGILGLEATGLTAVYVSPFHTSDYLQYLSQNFGLAKHSYAAGTGIGFDQLSPIVNLWIAFRNIAYLVFVIVFVVIGFAVMLRAKIDPRTVMTIENQIPKLIVALILITFSFAIAGLMIDIMWVAIYLIINLFGNLDPVLRNQIGTITTAVKNDPFTWVNSLNNGFGGFLGIAGQAALSVNGIVISLAKGFFSGIGPLKFLFYNIISLPTFITCMFGTIFSSIFHITKDTLVLGGLQDFWQGLSGKIQSPSDFGACIDAGLANIIGGVMTAVVFIVFSIALIVAIARLWWQLIKAYTLFIIFAIFGPIIIMMGVVPGSKTNFEYWARHMLAWSLVFPTSIAIFLLGKTLMDVYIPVSTASPPLLGAVAIDLRIAGVGTTIGMDPKIATFLGPLLGFAIIMLAPQALSMVEEGLGAPEPKFLAGIGQAIGVGAQAFGGGTGKVWDRYFRAADPLHNLDEGWIRKIILPQDSWIRRVVIGKETGLGLKPNQLGKTGGHG